MLKPTDSNARRQLQDPERVRSRYTWSMVNHTENQKFLMDQSHFVARESDKAQRQDTDFAQQITTDELSIQELSLPVCFIHTTSIVMLGVLHKWWLGECTRQITKRMTPVKSLPLNTKRKKGS